MSASAFTLPTTFSAIDKFTGPVKRMGGSVEAFAASAERSVRKVNRTASEVAQKTGLIGAAIIAPLAIAGKTAADFQKQMASVSTLVDTSRENMVKMGQDVLKLATKIPKPISELTAGLYDVRSAGIAAADSMSVLENAGKLATAGQSTTAEATNLLTSSINAFKSEGLKATEISDILFKTVKAGKTTVAQLAQNFGATASIVQSAGVKLADFQAATAALTTTGTPASQAQNQIRAAIVALQKPTADMEKIMAKLGVTSEKQLINKFGSVVGAFKAVNTTGKAMNINLAKAWSSIEAGAAVTSLTGATNEAYVKTLKDMTSGTGALNEAFEKAKLAESAQLASNNIQALTITLGTSLVPMFNKFVKKATPVVNKIMDWMNANQEIIGTILKITAAIGGFLLVVSGISAIVAAVTKVILFFGAAAKIATAVQLAWNAAMLANPIGLIIGAIVVLVGVIALIINKWDEWGAAVSLFMGPLGLVIGLFQAFRRNWDMIVEAFKTGGIKGALIAIGATILDALLMPMQQLAQIIADFTGAEWAQNAANNIQAFRSKVDEMARNEIGIEGGGSTAAINPRASQTEAISRSVEERIQEKKFNLVLENKTKDFDSKLFEGDNLIPSIGSSFTVG